MMHTVLQAMMRAEYKTLTNGNVAEKWADHEKQMDYQMQQNGCAGQY